MARICHVRLEASSREVEFSWLAEFAR